MKLQRTSVFRTSGLNKKNLVMNAALAPVRDLGPWPTTSFRNRGPLLPVLNCSRLAAAIIGCSVSLVSAHGHADQNIALCQAGLITLPSFEQHIADLRGAERFDPERIEELIARQRKGGADFFTSQIIIQEQRSGSGTYDLRLFHGLSGPHTKFRTVKRWACGAEDYPIAYFVGFRVKKIERNQIFVSREKDVVNVISLKKLDPDLNKRTSVKMFQSGRVLCADIGVGCIDGILFNRYES
jgi:hypothetical protein